jgi:hypothetical protein
MTSEFLLYLKNYNWLTLSLSNQRMNWVELVVFQLEKNIPVFCRVQSFIIVHVRVRQWTISCISSLLKIDFTRIGIFLHSSHLGLLLRKISLTAWSKLDTILYSSRLHAHYGSQSSLAVSWQRISYQPQCYFKSHMKPSLHRLIPLLPLFCNFQLSSIPLPPRSYPCRLASRNSTQFYAATANLGTLPCNHFARTTQKTQSLCCWEGVFTTPLRSNGSYSVVAFVFVVAEICLPSRCLALKVCSDFAILAFWRHVTIWISVINLVT